MYIITRKWILLVTLALLICTTMAFGEDRVHVLKQGETIYAISQKYHVSADSIMKINGITDPSRIRSGQKIIIPDVYLVEKGDTLYGIARSHGISFQNLLDANGLTKDSMIKVGDSLFIPPVRDEIADNSSIVAKPSAAQDSKVVYQPGQGALPERPLTDPRTFETKKIDSSIIWPVTSKQISYLSGKVFGVSIVGSQGETVKAIASGTVVSTGPYRGFGQVVFIQAKSGYIYVYGGLNSGLPPQGTHLGFGDSIGTLGADSLSGKPLLYFMVYNKDSPVDPAKAPRGY